MLCEACVVLGVGALLDARSVAVELRVIAGSNGDKVVRTDRIDVRR